MSEYYLISCQADIERTITDFQYYLESDNEDSLIEQLIDKCPNIVKIANIQKISQEIYNEYYGREVAAKQASDEFERINKILAEKVQKRKS